ncbi:thioredoxin [candidate division KSB3 bacterium]|uniref:Thioredoxin n=1 Tax=candidate division KSB3 bacterium TaxID=2044937 RepID=A0A9D5JTM9_9BACT|nr:thioredoxin [candidate division KSB3 bacterium]MBD3323752.1 thioredoxin [candidate division KSB3 bacterium]
MSETIVILNDANFEEKIVNSPVPALVDLWAPWCAPCRMIAPAIEELAEEYQGKAVIGKLNVDENPTTASRFGVTSIPTLLFFKNGEAKDQMIGVPAGNAKKVIEQKLKNVVE